MPNHIVIVSDRLISTGSGQEIDSDRYKHFVLLTDDAKAIVSFAGFAGIEGERTTIDWLVDEILATCRQGHHSVDEHLDDIWKHAQEYIDDFKRRRIGRKHLRLVIMVSGWIGSEQFNCVIDNCLDKYWTWSEEARNSFKARIRNYAEYGLKDGCAIGILGSERLALKQRALGRKLEIVARREDTGKVITTAVEMIRAVAPASRGAVGLHCSSIRIPRDDSGIQAYDYRDMSNYDVLPDCVISKSGICTATRNFKGFRDENHRPKPAAKLIHLVAPAEASTPRKRMAFWHRAIERLRLLHNEYGTKVRNSNSKDKLDHFHEWQRNNFDPVNTAALHELSQVISQLQAEDPDGKWRGGQFTDQILDFKKIDSLDTTWDGAIDLRDVPPFMS
ncbi:hypothetical protein ACFLXO_04840 [Chloroflexota bacterium]